MPQTSCGFTDVSGGASGAVLLATYGPTLGVDIGFDPQFSAALQAVPVAGIKGVKALVDTGAGQSCIDSLLAAQLNLPIVDKQPVSGVHGCQVVNMHLAQVHIPSLNATIYGSFAGVHLVAGGQIHQAIIGRAFLQHYTMLYDGRTGAVTISN